MQGYSDPKLWGILLFNKIVALIQASKLKVLPWQISEYKQKFKIYLAITLTSEMFHYFMKTVSPIQVSDVKVLALLSEKHPVYLSLDKRSPPVYWLSPPKH